MSVKRGSVHLEQTLPTTRAFSGSPKTVNMSIDHNEVEQDKHRVAIIKGHGKHGAHGNHEKQGKYEKQEILLIPFLHKGRLNLTNEVLDMA